jgi:hypothetical protein
MYCKNCGTENSDGDRFCKSCGRSLIAIACGIVAIVFAKKENAKGIENGYTKAGFICGLIGAILGGLYLIVYLVALIIYGSASLVLIGNEFV